MSARRPAASSGASTRAKDWRKDTVTYVAQNESLLNGSSRTEQDGIIKQLGSSADYFVGYKVASAATNGYYFERQAFAHLGGNDIDLLPPTTFTDVGGFSSANALLKLSETAIWSVVQRIPASRGRTLP